MTKEEFLELQKDYGRGKRINIGIVCKLPVSKKISYLMRTYNVSFDTITVLAKELNIDLLKDENSMVSNEEYRKMKEILVERTK